MPYTPNNNPYIPGDPYSYDLKWIVDHVKNADNILSNLDARIDEAVRKALDASDPIYYSTVQDMIDGNQNAKSLAYVLGYHEAEDGGSCLYYVTDDYNDIIGRDFFITIDANKWAVPFFIGSAVSPEIFGAYGDGINDDAEALQLAFDSGYIVKLGNHKNYLINDTLDINHDNFRLDGNGSSITAGTDLIRGLVFTQYAKNIEISGVAFNGTGNSLPIVNGWNYYGVYLNTSENVVIRNCRFKDLSTGGIFIVETNHISISDCVVSDVKNQSTGGCIVAGYGTNANSMGFIDIRNNKCLGGHLGIECQGWLHDVLIENNLCDGQYGYGILCYLANSDPSQVYENVKISKNSVFNTHYNPDSGYYNGMGIYLQTIGKAIVTENYVKNVLLDRPDAGSPNRTLLPGAISFGGSYDYVVSNNIIEDSVIDGIAGSNVPQNNNAAIVSNNTITNCGDFGVYINPIDHLSVMDNMITNCRVGVGQYGYPGRTVNDIVISGNTFRSCTTAVNVAKGTGTDIENVTISGNVVSNMKTIVFGISDLLNGKIMDNKIASGSDTSQTAGYCVQMTSCEKTVISGNMTGGTTKFFGGIYTNNCTEIAIVNNVIKSILSSSRIYSINSSTTVISGNLDDVNALVPQTTRFQLSSDPTYANRIIFNGDAAPTSGTYARGSICFNTLPGSGSPIGWICTASGTPGTWTAMPTI